MDSECNDLPVKYAFSFILLQMKPVLDILQVYFMASYITTHKKAKTRTIW